MRLVLAVLVVIGHSLWISGDDKSGFVFPFGLNKIRPYLVLSMFFSLSGFLVAASLVRVKKIHLFIILRALRIAPALIVEVVISSLIIGPLLTTTNLGDYFSSREFASYQLNMIGWPHYLLPGVFQGHPISRTVNGSIWTVPYEAECYIALAIFGVLGIVRSPRGYFCGFLALTIVLCILEAATPSAIRAPTATGRQLVLFFLAGVLLYLNRNSIVFSKYIAILSVIAIVPTITSQIFIYISVFPVAYLTAYIGLLRPPKIPIIFKGDYSYGVYLYAFPIQQAVFQLFSYGATWWGNLVISLLTVSMFAAFSWHIVEKPALRFKRLLIEHKQPRTSTEMISPDKTREAVATT